MERERTQSIFWGVVWSKKNALSLLIVCCGILLALPVLATSEGTPCIPEPTDEFIEYGDLMTCEISEVGDSDIFRFLGESGEKVVLQVTDQAGPGGPHACIELFGPGGTLIRSLCSDAAARIDIPLNELGEYLVRITEGGND